MQHTASSHIISDATIALTSGDTGKIAQFFDADGMSYWGTILSVESSTSAALATDGELPEVDTEVFSLSLVGDGTEPVPPGTVTLQGSNDGTTWTDILSVDPSTVTGEYSATFDAEYKFYRVDGLGSYSASLSETYIDRLVIWKSLSIIYPDFMKEPNDVWGFRAIQAAEYYTNALASVQALIDTNANGIADSQDSVQTTQRRFTR